MAFKEDLKKRRIALGMAQPDLAYAIKVSPTTISLWERGVVKPSFNKVIALANFFGITEQELLHPKDDTEGNEDSKNVL